MFSILKPATVVSQTDKKKIAFLWMLMITCQLFCWSLLLALFVMASPPNWIRWMLPIVAFVLLYLGRRLYLLQNPQNTVDAPPSHQF